MLRLFSRPIAVAASAAISTSSSFCDKKKPMFNRILEKTNFKNILNSEAKLSIITGENNCGKSTTMHSLLDELKKRDSSRSILRVDLRQTGISTPDHLVNRIAAPFNLSVLESYKILGLVENVEIRAGDTAGVKVEFKKSEQLTKFIETLDLLTYNLQIKFENSAGTGATSLPILFIDEAQKLNRLMKTPDGEEALQCFFDFCVLNTKQNPRCHIVLVSSDSFFLQWVKEHIQVGQFTPYVIGPLSKKEAERYWKEVIIPDFYDKVGRASDPPPFEDAYSVAGGIIMYLDDYAEEYIWNNKVSPATCGLIREAEFHFSLARDSVEESVLGSWSPDCDKILQDIVHAPKNYLVYKDAVEQYGEVLVHEMIRANILRLRPSPQFVYDIEKPPNDGIVTISYPALFYYLKEEEYKKKETEK